MNTEITTYLHYTLMSLQDTSTRLGRFRTVIPSMKEVNETRAFNLSGLVAQEARGIDADLVSIVRNIEQAVQMRDAIKANQDVFQTVLGTLQQTIATIAQVEEELAEVANAMPAASIPHTQQLSKEVTLLNQSLAHMHSVLEGWFTGMTQLLAIVLAE